MTTLFISDLHLDEQRPEISKLFLDFLAGEARQAEALYILGDLFESWIGDDDDNAHYAQAKTGLRALADSGVPLYFMHGNRDFLIGEQFARETGCTLLSDPTLIDLYGTPTLLMHGDTLCTDDVDYQQFRQRVRNPQWQQQFLSQPLAERRAFAEKARQQSKQAQSGKDMAIMDVNADAVLNVFKQHQIARMIHGHTHRPAVHDLTINGRPTQRIVLGDWYEQGSVLRCNENSCQLDTLSREESK